MEERISKLLPAKIQELRKMKRLNQKHVAQLLGVSEAMYSRMENGERAIQLSQIGQIAKILGANVKDLRSLCLADKIKEEAKDYSKKEINDALKVFNNA